MIQLKPNNDIEYKGFILTESGINAVGSPTLKQWELVGEFIKRSHKSVKFWQGDWLNYGEDTYPEWSQYFDESEPGADELRKEKWVAKRIPQDRRHPQLSWSHHEEVADLEPEEQERMFSVALENKLSIHKFRKLVSAYQIHLDLPELPEEELQKTDPEVFAKVQEIINSSIHTVELLESLDWQSVHKDAKDFLMSHIKKALGFYLDVLKDHDKQKSLSKAVV
ncbi:MAG: hypothetical protein NUV86_09600 [Candidatus Scalindua sp.]|nr:hypothetical protein [Candidatus Scalindua sp.]